MVANGYSSSTSPSFYALSSPFLDVSCPCTSVHGWWVSSKWNLLIGWSSRRLIFLPFLPTQKAANKRFLMDPTVVYIYVDQEALHLFGTKLIWKVKEYWCFTIVNPLDKGKSKRLMLVSWTSGWKHYFVSSLTLVFWNSSTSIVQGQKP